MTITIARTTMAQRGMGRSWSMGTLHEESGGKESGVRRERTRADSGSALEILSSAGTSQATLDLLQQVVQVERLGQHVDAVPVEHRLVVLQLADCRRADDQRDRPGLWIEGEALE